MDLNGYGSHRLHQVEVEWTPEWEDAYQRLLELEEKRRSEAEVIADTINRKVGRLLVLVGPIALIFFALDWDWLAGISIAGIVVMLFYLLSQYDSSKEHEDPTSSELYWLLGELHLLRSFTHDHFEMSAGTQHEERRYDPEPDPDDDDPTSAIRDRLEEIRLSIEDERYAWLKPADRDVLFRLSFRRKYGRIRLKELRKLEESRDE